MFLRHSSFEGVPVYDEKSGKKLGTINEIIYDLDKKKIDGFFVNCGIMSIKPKILAFINVSKINKDKIYTKAEKLKSIKPLPQKIKYSTGLWGKWIYTRNGNLLGKVSDIFFSEKDGNLEALEMTEGFISDIIKGRDILPLLGKVEFAKEIVVVENEVLEESIHYDTYKGEKNE